MSSDRWRQVEDLCHAALARRTDERRPFLVEACAGDEGLLREVESLIAQEAGAEGFMRLPAAALAGPTGFEPLRAALAGTRFGSYTIRSLLGVGGMGEVYRAHDETLGREVAIKLLSPAFTADPERRARFEREARMLATLNHPHVGAIYGVEEADGVRGLVLELVEGATLAERIAAARGAGGSASGLPIAEALAIARQVGDALEAAHEKGIVHRDLKPANIKITPDGVVKVLDFGLAKVANPDSSSSDLTQSRAGAIFGTAAYMSPEQARGHNVDKRADIWAFGCVLYEMLTGRRAFAGETASDTIAKILERDPDWAALPAATPARIRLLLRRCLAKDPKQRLRDIGDVRIEMDSTDDALPAVSGETMASSAREKRGTTWLPWIALNDMPVVPRSRWREIVPWVVAAGLAVALALSLARAFARAPENLPVRRFTFAVPARAAPNWDDFDVAVSPDGRHIAYNCREGNAVSICVRSLDSLAVRQVAEGRDAVEWFFSPDGEWLAIADRSGLSKVSIHGGRPQPIVRWSDEDRFVSAFSWGRDDYILFGGGVGIRRVAASGGKTEPVTRIAPDSKIGGYFEPWILPDGRSAIITIGQVDGTYTAGLVNLGDGTVRDLGIRGYGFVYLPQGWLAFKQGTTVFAAAFDPRDPTRLGTPMPVIENVSSSLRLARDGSLVYIPTRGESSARLVWVDRDGRPTRVEAQRLDYTHLALAPDGRRALLNLPGKIDLIDLQQGTRKPLVGGAFPIWSPKGDRVTFTGRGGLAWAPADGSGKPALLVRQAGMIVATSWNAVTGDLAYYDHRDFEIWIRSPDGKTRRFLGAPGRKRSGRFSPDGKWIAFVSDETGEYQVYVAAYPGPGPTVAVSSKGGLSPIWSPDGHELFFRLGEKMMAARMTNQSPPAFTVTELFDGPYTLDLMGHQREDVAADGKRFLMVENSDDFPIVFVQNWPEELRRLVKGK